MKTSLSILLLLFMGIPMLSGQNFTETFEDETTGNQDFSDPGNYAFTTNNLIEIGFFANGGRTGPGDDRFLEAASVPASGLAGEILWDIPVGEAFQMESVYVYVSNNAGTNTYDGPISFTGTLTAGGTATATFNVVHPGSFSYAFLDFSGTPLDGVNLDKVEVILDDAAMNYIALDDFNFNRVDPNAVTVTINDISMAEGNSGNTPFNFTVTRTNNNTTFSVTAASANGSAMAGSDYTVLAPTLVNFVMGGSLTQTVTVNVTGDLDPEADENFYVNLSLPTNGATILDNQGEGEILDDDTVCETFEDEAMAGLTAFSENSIDFITTDQLVTGFFSPAGGGCCPSDYYLESDINNVPHSGSVGDIQINTPGKVFQVVQLDLWLSTDGNPLTSQLGDVTFIGTLAAGGTATATLTTTMSGGSWSPNLSFSGTPLDGQLLTALEVVMQAGGDYVAIDNFKFASFDNTSVLVSIDDVCMNEGNSGNTIFTFTISRNDNSTDFDVTLQSANGTAMAGSDYTAFGPVVLNFTMNGAFTQTVDVLVSGDLDSEDPETFFMNLSNPTNGAIIANGQGISTIKDDDTICETFEDEAAVDLMAFSEGGVDFVSTGELVTDFFAGGGGAGSDYYLDSDVANFPHPAGSVGQIQVNTYGTAIKLLRFDFWLSNDNDPNDSETGTIRLIGHIAGGGTATADFIGSASGGDWNENVSLSGSPLDGLDLVAIDVVLLAPNNYLALDNICFESNLLCDLVVNCPPDPATIEGCGTADIVPTSNLMFSTMAEPITEAEFLAEGGSFTTSGTIQSITYQDVLTSGGPGNCPFVVTRTFTLTDDCILQIPVSCTQTFTIEDTTPPMINCPPTLNIEGCSTADITVSSGLPFSPMLNLLTSAQLTAEGGSWSDNCTPQLMIQYQDVVTPNSSCPIIVTRTFTVTDVCGNTAQCMQTINIDDTTDPMITCPGTQTRDVDANCNYLVEDFTGLANASDNCGGVSVTQSPAAGMTFNGSGNTVIVLTATDGCGNTETCNMDLILQDVTPPMITTCPPDPANTIEGCDENDVFPTSQLPFSPLDSTITPSQFMAEGGMASDNCGIVSATYSDVASGACPLTVTRTWTVSDGTNSSVSCTQTFIVDDTSAPMITVCPPDQPMVEGCGPTDVLNASALPLSNLVAVPITVQQFMAEGGTATDNCAITSYAYEDMVQPGNCPWTVVRTFTLQDACANFATCTQTFVIDDTTLPTPMCNDITVNLDMFPGTYTLTQSDIDAIGLGSFDNCNGPVTISAPATSFDCDDLGAPVPVTITVTDFCNNSETCVSNVTVLDPSSFCCSLEVTCPTANDIGTFDCNNPVPPLPTTQAEATAAPYNIVFGMDPCGTILVSSSDDMTIMSCGTVNQMITRTIFIWDDLPGGTPGVFDAGVEESASCIFTFTFVPDTTPPVAPNPPGPVTVQCATDIPAPVQLTAQDACDGPITVSPTAMITPGACANRFTMVRTWTFTDGCNNSSSVSQTITVFDDTAPILSSMPGNTTVECDAIPSVPIITATDNCLSVQSVIFINEIHYDNDGGDVGEFIEVAGTAGYDLSNCELVLYNGNGGAPYNTMVLNGMIDNEGGGFGAVDFQYPSNGLQNGSSDGIALVCGGTVIEFISYEGTFIANGGPADGMMSVDIGVQETDDPPLLQSLQLTGTGCSSGDFMWNPPAPQSPGSLNAGQTFDVSQCQTSNDVPVMFSETQNPSGTCPQEYTIVRVWTAADPCGNSISHTQSISVVDTTVPEFCDPPADTVVDCIAPPAEDLTATDNCDFSGMNSIVWINEFHYDNTGGDVGEFIEIAGVAGTDLTGYQLYTYNGSNGLVYNAPMDLGGIIPNETCNRGALAFIYPVNGLQNGSPDGFALVDPNGNVIEFLSYEGSFVANDGPATGMVSTNVGVTEPGTTPVGFSLQLTGTAGAPQGFTWAAPAPESPGSLNAGQVMQGNLLATLDEVDNTTPCDGGTITRTWTVEDACGNMAVPHVQVITVIPPAAPLIVCPPDMTVQCEADIVVNADDAMVTTFCNLGFATWVDQPHITGARDCDGTTYEYTYHVVDDCGRGATCIQTWTLQNAAPTISVPAGTTVECAADIQTDPSDATVTTSCGEVLDVTIYAPVLSGTADCSGTTYTYTYRVEDQCEREATADRVFTIQNAGPTIDAPANTTCECLGGITPNGANATVDVSCDLGYDVAVTGPVASGPQDCPGTTYTYTYTATDDCGRPASDNQTFTINNGPPVFLNAPTIPLQLNCEDQGWEYIIQAWLASVKATNSCGLPLTVLNNYNPNSQGVCINNGTTVVTWRATDNCGRQSVAQSMIIINDTEPPVFTTPAQDELDICNYNTPAEFAAWVAAHGNAVAVDGCDQNITNNQWSTIPNNPQFPNCMNAMGSTSMTVTFVVRDDCGNKTSTTATFTALMTGGDFVEQGDGEVEMENDLGFSLYQNQPNPFRSETLISFNLPESTTAILTVYDVSGRVLKVVEGDYKQGYNEVAVNRSDLGSPGMLYYELKTATDQAVMKMILLD